MAKEVRELFGYVFFTSNTPFTQFYGGDYSVINSRLAQYYGVSGFSGGTSDWKATNILTAAVFWVQAPSLLATPNPTVPALSKGCGHS